MKKYLIYIIVIALVITSYVMFSKDDQAIGVTVGETSTIKTRVEERKNDCLLHVTNGEEKYIYHFNTCDELNTFSKTIDSKDNELDRAVRASVKDQLKTESDPAKIRENTVEFIKSID